MHATLGPLDSAQSEILARLLAEDALAREFDLLAAPGGLAHAFHDPHVAPEASALAYDGEAPVGFCLAAVVPQADGGTRAFLRLGVLERHRRRGHGSRLLRFADERLRAREGERLANVGLGAWTPAPAAEAFALGHGFSVSRHFWRLRRPLEPLTPPLWPAGIAARTFDGGDGAFRDLVAVHNDSFAEHWGFVPGHEPTLRAMVADPSFLPDGLTLAYRDGACVGYCLCERIGPAGVIAMLGVARAARGIGLGRALLRRGIGVTAAHGAAHVDLLVDGENESALRLYRSEGFEVSRTRTVWQRLTR